MPYLTDKLLTTLHRRKIRGADRLTSMLARGPFPLVRTRTTHGLTFLADPTCVMDLIILKTGYYEPHLIAAMTQLVRAGDVIWDIGANSGLHAITLKHLYPSATVVAFEPSPLNFTRLFLNCRANRLDVKLMGVALSNVAGYAPLSIMAEGNNGLNSLRPWANMGYTAALPTWCDTADALVRSGQVPQPNVIKLDVEGFELEVFQGMADVLASPALRCVFFEARPDLLSDAPSYPLAQLLRDHGFTVTLMGGHDNDFLAARPDGAA